MGLLEAGNENSRTKDFQSLDWLDKIGVKRGMGRGTDRINSHKSLTWWEAGNDVG